MQHDTVIWQVLNEGHCSFKAKLARERTFCRNPFNVTGFCSRSSCPLANSRYATVREHEGQVYLYLKSIERAHTPKFMWEKILLPSLYSEALQLISTRLEYFPKFLQHRNKQRLTKIHQYLIRMRQLRLRASPKIITTSRKIQKQESRRETKALKVSNIDNVIEQEMSKRLQQASAAEEEQEVLNYPEREFEHVLDELNDVYEDGEEDDDDDDYEMEDDEDDDEDYEMEDDIEDIGEYDMNGEEGFVEDQADGDDAQEEEKVVAPTQIPKLIKRARLRKHEVEIEYEEEERADPMILRELR